MIEELHRRIRGGAMREGIIISVILIVALLLWMPPKKGG